MGAKVYELNAYKKKKKKEHQLSIFEQIMLILDIVLSLSLGFIVITLINTSPKYPVFTTIFTILSTLFLLYHTYKTIQIYKRKQVKKQLRYFLPYILTITALALLTCGISFGFETSLVNKCLTFAISLILLLTNAFLLIKLSKRNPTLFD